MNTYNEIHNPAKIDFEFFRPNAVRHFPHSVECGSRWKTYGSSSGWSSDVIACATGEHFERKHFYLDIPVHDTNTLKTGLTEKEYWEFAKALAQTSVDGAYDLLHSHAIDRTDAYRISDLSKCRIPTASISISQSRYRTDNNLYPMRDTCGCSVHISVSNAILGALKESLERQFLLRYWLTKICTTKIKYTDACNTIENYPSLPLLTELYKSGELCILDLTDHRLPGSCILLCYGNRRDKLAKVKYCAGMAYASSSAIALNKAIIELWQTFRFMNSLDNNTSRNSEIEDPYLRHFLDCNLYETFQIISTPSESLAFEQNGNPPDPLTTQRLINTLRGLDINGYLYLSSIPFNQSHLYFCKYVSPNLFLHMNNSSCLNINNKYSEPFQHRIIPSQLANMVPFP